MFFKLKITPIEIKVLSSIENKQATYIGILGALNKAGISRQCWPRDYYNGSCKNSRSENFFHSSERFTDSRMLGAAAPNLHNRKKQDDNCIRIHRVTSVGKHFRVDS